ncbi:MAG: SDR family oxidoreductase [Desulfobacterales bacterium]
MRRTKPVLVVGATGYVGGRLIPKLLSAGYKVRAVGRSLEKMGCRPWAGHPSIEIMQGDIVDLGSMKKASAGCWAAVYLVHSMISQKSKYADADREGAKNMVTASSEAGLEKIIYLGGLGDINDPRISNHLKSRHEVADILQSGPTPATHLRAAMILGAGSASFEMLRYLVDRLPIMITPKWVNTPCQPIAIANVLNYLQGCLEHDETDGGTFDICGPDVLTYKELINMYTQISGLPGRIIIPVPFLTPKLSAKWIHLVTPIPASIAQPLAEGLSVPVVCKSNKIRNIVKQKLYSCRETIRTSLERIKQELVETCWSDAGTIIPPEWVYCGDADYAGGTILESGFYVRLKATPEKIWEPVRKIGGKTGWYFADTLWWIRGTIDRLSGGVGLRRGRRHPREIYVGDALDFFRVLEVENFRRLVLLAEMKLPGEAIAQFEITPAGPGVCELTILSRFLPSGLAGILYWYALLPFHNIIFYHMLKNMARSTGMPIVKGPEPITPRLKDACVLPVK